MDIERISRRGGLAVAAALSLMAGPALAMPNSLTMTCSAAQALVKKDGQVVIGTGPNVYDRYVSGQRYCGSQMTTTPAWIATSDSKQCFVGYRCREQLIHDR